MSTDVVELISEAWRQLRAADLDGARSTFRAALEIDDQNFDAWIGLGRCDRGSGDLDAAVDDFTRAASIQPAAARPFCERGAIEILRGNYSESLRDYEHARQVDPTYPTLDSYFAELYLYLDRPLDALKFATDGLRSGGDDLMNRVNIAHALLQLGDSADAVAIYRSISDEQHPGKRVPMRTVIKNDFRLLREADVQMGDIATAEAALD